MNMKEEQVQHVEAECAQNESGGELRDEIHVELRDAG